ncbi:MULTISPECIES: hypothetical protein [unclassified Modestobacter]
MTKLASLRSTWWAAAVYALLAGGFGWLAAATTPSAEVAGDAVGIALIGFGFAQLVVVVLGVVVGAGEFSTGMVLASLAAVPRRVRWLAGKTAVVAGAVGALTAASALICWLAARTLTGVPGGVPLPAPGVGSALVLQVVGAALTAALAVGLGAALRSTAGGVGAGIGLVFGLPLVLPLFGDVAAWLARALPVLRVGGVPFLVDGPGWQLGLVVTAAWAGGAWLLAAVLLVRRDV